MRGCDVRDPQADAVTERLSGLGAGDRAPTSLLDGPQERRVALLGLHAQQPAFPFPEEHLAQLRLHARHDAEPLREWRRCLHRAPQRRDVDGGDVLAAEAAGDPLRLLHADRIERRVAVPVDEFEGTLGIGGLGLAVTHKEDLGRARRRRVAMLAITPGLALRLAHGPQEYGAAAVAAALPTATAEPELATAPERR